ncbi:cytochrome c oxidase subunit II [Comamonas resistens]|uniref:Cytochrome c oxidase subunit 2 n=1 Tax=Comamonas resistens TaxID=3046670 RepID=A0ABY8SNM9_9BURK|nr:cytochrome c oxidase subunit II [Comamonas resistens]MDL5036328.1 cytochrome c oxidase subunit II [Comamonas resistens]WHS64675.1 cytochrome c oxidase subunit II [Comamonas resistens]
MKNISTKLVPWSLALAAWGSSMAHAVQDLPGGPAVNQLNLHPPVTRIAVEQHGLHWMMLIICTLIFIGVFGVMFYSIWMHRKSKGAQAANFHESVKVEVAWTIIPFIIVVLIALPATKVLVAQKDTTNADLTIKATGYQWKWGYDYLTGEGAGLSYISTLDTAQRQMSNSGDVSQAPVDYLFKVDNPLVVPVGKKVRVITTANDVIHSFMVPAFGIKQDAIPGFVRDTWFKAEKTGDYYGQCAELCGKEHAYMPIHVKVLSSQDYSAWVEAEQKKVAAKADDPNKVWVLTDLVARGEKVYAANCAACHQANGKGAGPIKPLDGSAVVLGPTADMMHAVLEGRANGAMPSWKQLSDTDLAAVVTFAKNHWSNQTGQLVQPAQFVAARGGQFPEGGGSAAPAATPAPAAPEAAAPAAASDAGPFQVFFDSGKSALDDAAQAEVKKAAEYWNAHKDGKIALSGFVDATGSADKNAELAKERAKAVAKLLSDSGIASERIELRKPQTITAGSDGADKQARRVDIVAAQ